MFLSLLIISTVIGFILVIVSSLATPNSFLDRFSGKLSALLFLYLALGVFLTYNLQETALDDMQRQATLHVNEKSGMGVNKIIADNYQNCPNFCQSLYFDWQKENLGWKKTNIKEKDEWQAVMYINFSLIQAMKDVLVVLGVDTTELSAWIATFIQWCHSPKFR